MINEKTVRRYCSEEPSKIENYDLAFTDMEHTWHCHHRLELGENGEVTSLNDLKKHGLYYGRPASELIFLTNGEHRRIHNQNRHVGDDVRRRMSESHKGKHPSEDTRKKIGEAKKGNKHFLGHKHSEETKMRISEWNKGRKMSEETRRKMSEARKAYYAKRGN